jgi:hypothetical protein
MAQINVSFDTNNKEFSVTIDGQTVSDVNYVSLYVYGDTPEISIETRSEEVDGIRVSNRITASKEAEKQGVDIDNFVSTDKTLACVTKSIANTNDAKDVIKKFFSS